MIEVEYLKEICTGTKYYPLNENYPVFEYVQGCKQFIKPSDVVVARTFNGFLLEGENSIKEATFLELVFDSDLVVTTLYTDTLLSVLKNPSNPNDKLVFYREEVNPPEEPTVMDYICDEHCESEKEHSII